jgi:hypothetical protein
MSDPRTDRTKNMCPYLGTRDEEDNPAPCVDYPSFENMCFVASQPEAILLTDQATFCLSSGYRHCPRLTTELDATAARNSRSARTDVPDGFASATDRSDPLMSAIADMEEALAERRRARARRKRRLGWISAAAIFLSTLVCGGLLAAYLGWELVNRETALAPAGSVTTLAESATPAAPPMYLIVTATSEPVIAGAAAPPSSTRVDPGQFPAAVTATPVPGNDNMVPAISQSVDRSQFGFQTDTQPAGVTPAAPAVNNMLVQIPTRRPTPILDLAITVPTVPEATAIPTMTPTPALGTPVVIFAAEDKELESGDCTVVSWHVENVRAVYYENLGVDGHGQQEECVRDKPGDYTLTIVLPNGGTEYYTLTVGLILPTETPTPTATHAPFVEPTATWTPVIPTDTPTPDMQYGVRLSVEGGPEHTCSQGESCEVELRLTNTSLGIDDISIEFLQSGDLDANLCRLDGVCSDNKLTLASVGPGNTALVLLSVDIPDDAAGMSETYVVKAISEGSGGSAGSDPVSITIEVQ